MATREEQFHYINKGQEDELECHGFKRDKVKTSVTAVFALCTLGLLFLVFYWRPEWFVWAQFTSCAPGEADVVLLRTMDDYRTWSKERVNIETKGSMHHQISLLETRCDGDTHQLQDLPTLSVDSSPDKPIIQGGGQSDDQSSRYFIHHCLKYVWNAEKQTFEKVRGLDSGMPCSLFYTLRQGLSSPDQENRRSLYGDNAITVEVKPYIKLLFYQVLNPFYIFQLFSVCLWMSDEYYYYASAIIIMSLGSIGISLYTIRKQSEMLHQMVESHNTMLVKVCRDGEVCSEVTSTDLVPGDVLVIPANGMLLPCDAALITGNCIVNESMLTGESVPVTKTPVPPQSSDLYSPEVHQRHTLFCGTQVIQTRYYGGEKVKAVVVRTGFSTAKGELVRSILFPKPLNFKLLTAAYRFVSVLVGVAMIGFTFTVAWMALDGESVGEIFLEALDLITICVPPALPSALTIGIIYAQRRLKKQGIFCISPERINICGLLDMVCFDKTGTLTEDGLDLWAVVPTKNNSFAPAIQDVSQLPLGPFLTAMATTHSLTVIGGNLSGDPLDLKMFQATKWELEEPGSEESTKFDMLVPTVVRPPQTMVLLHSPDKREHPYEVGILRQFPFSSSLQRMSVMTRTLGSDHMVVYTKGAPEMIIQLCKPHTIPADFYEVLMTYTESGFRVIALACRPLENKVRFLQAQRMERNEVETDLTFLGLMVMQNALKPETTPIIHQLREANIRTVMVTGDNILTAVSVARECRMVCPGQQVVEVTALPPTDSTPPNITYTVSTKHMEPQEEIKGGEIAVQMQEDTVDVDDSGDQFHFAVSGKSFAIIRKYFPHVLPKLAVGGTVFARMSPDQKTQLLEVYQDLGHYVGMCGDGANDCGALKRAHAGISLSELEASVASPFTSKKNDIQCVLTLIREGRCALVTSFGVFKFMALYSMIQFMSVLILYGVFANLGDTQYLYQDLVIITTIAFVMSRNSAYPKLVRQRPPTSLLRPPILFSVIVQIAIQLAFQLGAFYFLLAQPWFVPWEDYRLCNDGSMNVTVNTTDINATVGPTLKPCTVDYEDESDQGVWTYESATMFGIATFQYATLAFVFSKGKPFRQPVHTNWLYMLDLIILTALNVWLLLYPTEPVAYFMELSQFPDFTFRLWLLVGAAANFVISWLTEVLLADNNALWKWLTSSYHKHHKKKYQILREELLYDKDYGLPVGVIRPQGTGKEINSNVGHVGGTRSGSIDESDDMENSTYL
ncbi:PREDICTED: probable cation-transporting ATPase 13A3 isoform X5 [Branchiostoma belcheri]|uniref:Cation-transporting ATPase n=1 Tax=Branchiostoma belcheri TaxID=7741 RepID=A0A6P4YIN9_BRABE|nr:PREDICTED: probable cation-transporting ATPase 13A3 isoform X5 [Branchiostoma belcheri]